MRRAFFLALCALFSDTAAVLHPAWRMPGHDAARSSLSAFNGPLRGAAFKWVQHLSISPDDESIVIDGGGNLYVYGNYDRIFAFNGSTGILNHTFALPTCSDVPTIGDDGVLYFISSDPLHGCSGYDWGDPEFFAAVDSGSGALLWSVANTSLATRSPIVLHLGINAVVERIYFSQLIFNYGGDSIFQFLAIDNDNPSNPIPLLHFNAPTPTQQPSFDLAATEMMSSNEAFLAISVSVTSSEEQSSTLIGVQLFGYENAAQIIWTRNNVGNNVGLICLSRTQVYCSIAGETVTALDVFTGNTLWSLPISSYFCSIGFINSAEETVFCVADGSLNAIFGASGIVRWSYPVMDTILYTPSVGADGTVYFFSGLALYALNGRTGNKLWSFVVSDEPMQAGPISIGEDGTLFALFQHLSDGDHILLAIEDIPDSPSPDVPTPTPPPSSSAILAVAFTSLALSAAALTVSCAPRLAHLWKLLFNAPPTTFKANGEDGDGLLVNAYIN